MNQLFIIAYPQILIKTNIMKGVIIKGSVKSDGVLWGLVENKDVKSNGVEI